MSLEKMKLFFKWRRIFVSEVAHKVAIRKRFKGNFQSSTNKKS